MTAELNIMVKMDAIDIVEEILLECNYETAPYKYYVDAAGRQRLYFRFSRIPYIAVKGNGYKFTIRYYESHEIVEINYPKQWLSKRISIYDPDFVKDLTKYIDKGLLDASTSKAK